MNKIGCHPNSAIFTRCEREAGAPSKRLNSRCTSASCLLLLEWEEEFEAGAGMPRVGHSVKVQSAAMPGDCVLAENLRSRFSFLM